MSLDRRGLSAYAYGVPGFYVVNPKTNICVAAWSTEAEAQADIDRLDSKYPFDPIKLIVVEIKP